MPSTGVTETLRDVWSGVVGQSRAVEIMRAAARSPVHAYMLVGPRGSGKRALARAFAAAILSGDEGRIDKGDGDHGDVDPQEIERHVDLALREIHPDLIIVERVGASISADQADDIVLRANRTPVEGRRKVLILDEFHLIADRVGPKLLKTIEEPPEGTHFVVLVEEIPPALITVASRCVRVDLDALSDEVVAHRLVAEGLSVEAANRAALGAWGDLHRARILATDERFELRRRAWNEVPDRLDGTGSMAVVVADELLAMIEDAMAPLADGQNRELADFDEMVANTGGRGSGRKELVERHKREQRRYRTDELRFGLATLTRRYRDVMVSSVEHRSGARAAQAIDKISLVAAGLRRNPNERLQLVALFAFLGDDVVG